MAVVDKYVDAQAELGRLAERTGGSGGEVNGLENNFEVAAADSDNSAYRIVKGISPTTVISELEIFSDALTNGTDYVAAITYGDEVLQSGSVPLLVDLSGAMDLSSGAAIGSGKNALASVDIDQVGKTIAELIVEEDNARSGEDWSDPRNWMPIDLVIKAEAASSVAGTIAYKGKLISGD